MPHARYCSFGAKNSLEVALELRPRSRGQEGTLSLVDKHQPRIEPVAPQPATHGNPCAMNGFASPDSQPYTARLAGAGALLDELEAVLHTAPAQASRADFRRLIIEENAARKSTANARLWTWKRLKLRYLLDSPDCPEFTAFHLAHAAARTTEDRRIVAALMLARTDALFRDVTLDVVSRALRTPGHVVRPESIRANVEAKMHASSLVWSAESLTSITNHLLSALADFGFIEGSRVRRTARVRPGVEPTVFAATLGRLEGLTDRANLESRWFRLLGLDIEEAASALREAARAGALRFRMQADVVELVIDGHQGTTGERGRLDAP